MEFAEVRQYLPGDEVRTIDWNVTARTGTPHVKRFTEERELTVMLLVDASASTRFGTIRQFKQELAAEIAALLAYSAISNNDKIGLVIFSDRIELALRPRKGNRHVLRVIREILNHVAQGQGTDIPLALDHLNRVTPPPLCNVPAVRFFGPRFAPTAACGQSAPRPDCGCARGPPRAGVAAHGHTRPRGSRNGRDGYRRHVRFAATGGISASPRRRRGRARSPSPRTGYRCHQGPYGPTVHEVSAALLSSTRATTLDQD